jgi:hypothetical protein
MCLLHIPELQHISRQQHRPTGTLWPFKGRGSWGHPPCPPRRHMRAMETSAIVMHHYRRRLHRPPSFHQHHPCSDSNGESDSSEKGTAQASGLLLCRPHCVNVPAVLDGELRALWTASEGAAPLVEGRGRRAWWDVSCILRSGHLERDYRRVVQGQLPALLWQCSRCTCWGEWVSFPCGAMRWLGLGVPVLVP